MLKQIQRLGACLALAAAVLTAACVVPPHAYSRPHADRNAAPDAHAHAAPHAHAHAGGQMGD